MNQNRISVKSTCKVDVQVLKNESLIQYLFELYDELITSDSLVFIIYLIFWPNIFSY